MTRAKWKATEYRVDTAFAWGRVHKSASGWFWRAFIRDDPSARRNCGEGFRTALSAMRAAEKWVREQEGKR